MWRDVIARAQRLSDQQPRKTWSANTAYTYHPGSMTGLSQAVKLNSHWIYAVGDHDSFQEPPEVCIRVPRLGVSRIPAVETHTGADMTPMRRSLRAADGRVDIWRTNVLGTNAADRPRSHRYYTHRLFVTCGTSIRHPTTPAATSITSVPKQMLQVPFIGTSASRVGRGLSPWPSWIQGSEV